MYTNVKSHGLFGIEGYTVNIEVDIYAGMPTYSTVGLPDAAVRESRERVQSAIKNSRYSFPIDKVIINLAPADMRKEGTHYDLPIALGILVATRQVSDKNIGRFSILGELALDGTVRGINGILPMVIDACERGEKNFIIPAANAREAAHIEGVNIFAVENLKQAALFLDGKLDLEPTPIENWQPDEEPKNNDFSLIQGQYSAKRAVEIAVAGGHNILLIGTPGSGKTMISRSIPSILPDLSKEEAIEITKIHSISGELSPNAGLISQRPYRSPHHTSSAASLVGGSTKALPGEISLAHLGVLFLDEFPEFKRDVLEAMRQPLEDGFITVSRATFRATYPANFMLVAAMNPCPCGNYGSKHTKCRCSLQQIKRYQQRISGPMLDRIDLHIEMTEVEYSEFTNTVPAESSKSIKARVNAARELQRNRYKGTNILFNAQMDSAHINEFCSLDSDGEKLMEMAFSRLKLSARAYKRLKKVARTIADLDNSQNISAAHISEAIQYRSLDSKYWGN